MGGPDAGRGGGAFELRLAGVPLDQVSGAFHYVRPDRTVRPAELLDAAGLRALVEGLPAA